MKSFKELGVKDQYIQGMAELGIITPSPIQETVIPLLINGNTDLVGQAQTGTGKTAAFGIPLLHKVDPGRKAIQGLILCPTRELGQQVAKQLFRFTKFSDKIFTECVYGGAPIDQQISNLRRTTHIVVATPGRLIDLVNRKAIDLSQVKTVVLDEADEMLSMGFKKELDQILAFCVASRNKWLFSATIPHGIKQIVNQHLSPQAHHVVINSRNIVNKKIEHKYVICDEREKFDVLIQFLKGEKEERGVIFCKTKKATQLLAKQLIARNIAADGLHGDLKQLERDKVMRAFKNKSLRLLVATDIAARGIDVDNLAFVVHYELPDQDEYYTHRSGRTARAGKEGLSLCIMTTKEMKQLRYIEKNLRINFKQIKTR